MCFCKAHQKLWLNIVLLCVFFFHCFLRFFFLFLGRVAQSPPAESGAIHPSGIQYRFNVESPPGFNKGPNPPPVLVTYALPNPKENPVTCAEPPLVTYAIPNPEENQVTYALPNPEEFTLFPTLLEPLLIQNPNPKPLPRNPKYPVNYVEQVQPNSASPHTIPKKNPVWGSSFNFPEQYGETVNASFPTVFPKSKIKNKYNFPPVLPKPKRMNKYRLYKQAKAAAAKDKTPVSKNY